MTHTNTHFPRYNAELVASYLRYGCVDSLTFQGVFRDGAQAIYILSSLRAISKVVVAFFLHTYNWVCLVNDSSHHANLPQAHSQVTLFLHLFRPCQHTRTLSQRPHAILCVYCITDTYADVNCNPEV